MKKKSKGKVDHSHDALNVTGVGAVSPHQEVVQSAVIQAQDSSHRKSSSLSVKGFKVKATESNDAKVLTHERKLTQITLMGDPCTVEIKKKNPWDKFLVPFPKTQKHNFINEILPDIYSAKFGYLQSNFETYFLKEREQRWDWSQTLSTFDSQLDKLIGNKKNFNSLGPLCSGKPLKPTDNNTLYQSEKKLEELEGHLKDLKCQVAKKCDECLFNNKQIKKGADEEHSYCQKIFDEIEKRFISCKDLKAKVEEWKRKLNETFTGVSKSTNRKAHKSRAIKENKHKVKKASQKTKLGFLQKILLPASFQEIFKSKTSKLATRKVCKDDLKAVFHVRPILDKKIFGKIPKSIFTQTAASIIEARLGKMKKTPQ